MRLGQAMGPSIVARTGIGGRALQSYVQLCPMPMCHIKDMIEEGGGSKRRRGGGPKSLYIGKLPYYPLNKL